jgi:alpha-L-fucosidase
MTVNGEAIYASRPVAPYSTGNIFYTQSKDSNNVYACWLSDKDTVFLPATIQIPVSKNGKPKKMAVLAAPKERVKWTYANNVVTIQTPAAWQRSSPFKHCVVFKFSW